MKDYNIALIPGDGIGKEVSLEAVKVLKAVSEKHGFGVKTENFDWSCDYYLKHGEMGPENVSGHPEGVRRHLSRLHRGCQQGP